MKLKYLFPIFIAIFALMASCVNEESVTLLDEIQVSSSYIAIPDSTGGSETITITSKQDWAVDTAALRKSKVDWLRISKISGSAGESEIKFEASPTQNGRTAEVLIHSAGKTQRINVIQGLATISAAKVAEVKAGPDGKTFRVTGVCTRIANTLYGNWYIADETGELYIYGTLDKKGQTKNFLSLGIEVGDEVTIEGPKSTYAGAAQMVDVMVININKSLIKVDSVYNEELPVEGGVFEAYIISKGQGVSVEIPEDAKSWLSISSIQTAGTNTVVKFNATPNTGGDRSTLITFKTTDGKKFYSTETTLKQKGAIVQASIAEFLAAPVSETQYRLTGVITKIANDKYGNLDIRDFSGETYVYGIKDFTTKGLKVGDIITIVGKRAAYNGTPQVAGAILETVIPVSPITIAEILTKPVDTKVYFMLTGVITEIQNDVYGNIVLKDGDSQVLMYGCHPGYGATGDFRKGLVAAKGLKVGDTITVIATRGEFGGTAQLANGFYFSHVSAQ